MASHNRPPATSRKSGSSVIQSRDLTQEYLEKEMTRRRMLQAALASASLAACGTEPGTAPTPTRDAGTDRPPSDVPTTPRDVPPARMTHLVGAGQNDDHIMAAEAALAETTGFDFVQRGQRVYLKVNTNSGDPFPYSTSPDMIRWVVGKIRERGGEVFIGDRSFWGDANTMRNFQGNGIAEVAQELGVQLMVFGDTGMLANGRRSDATGVDWIDLPMDMEGVGVRSAVWDGAMRIPMAVAMADHIVNMPCVKTHFIATFTMGMKNMIGIINPIDRSRMRNLGGHDGRAGGRLYPQVAFMNKAGPTVSLNVLDGWNALISGGPTPNDRPSGAPAGWMPMTAEPKVVIISRDRVAADLTGAALLRTLAPRFELVNSGVLWNNRQLSVAIASGLGITSREQFDLSGPTVSNIAELRTIATMA